MDNPEKAKRVGVVVVHGVGETHPGDTIDSLMAGLKAVDPTLISYAYGRHYRLPEQRPTGPGDASIHTQEATLGSASVTLVEMHWADLTKVGVGQLQSLLMFFRITFEAHHLVDGLLQTDRSFIGRLYLLLLRIATSWLRGPIAGLSVCFICAGLALVFLEQILEALPQSAAATKALLSDLKEWVVVLVLGLLIAFGFRIASKSKPDDVWWADIAVGTAIIAVLLLALMVFFKLRNPSMAGPAVTLFVDYYPALRYVWVPWAIAVHAAAAIYFMSFVPILPGFLRLKCKGAGVALALVFLQSSMWLAIVPVASYYIISQVNLFENAAKFYNMRPDAPEIIRGRAYHLELGVIFLINALALMLIAFVAYRIYQRRWQLTQQHAQQPDKLEAELPPLIVNQRILVAIGAGAVVILAVLGLILSDMLRDHLKLDVMPSWLNYKAFYSDSKDGSHWIRMIMAGLFWYPVYLLFKGLWSILGTPVQNTGLVSVRQLTDHFFRPRQSFAWWLRPSQRAARSSLPRREILQSRLNRVIAEVLPADNAPLDTLIFVAHSQGTVVLLEHFKSLSQLPSGPGPKPHIVTLGSPIGQVYQKYAFEYAALADELRHVRPHVASWTNMYRVNDPIGGPIACTDADFIRNIRKPVGEVSHTDYWRDEDVCKVIIDLIKNGDLQSRPASTPSIAALPPTENPIVPS